MPIRTDHGRNATLRALATWPLHSPQRLLGTITMFVALCIAITIVTGTSTTPATPSSTPVWSVSRSTSSSSSAPQSVTLLIGDPLAAARRFADAWITPAEPPTWRDHLAPLCTDEFRTVVLPTLNPAQESVITGSPTLVRAHTGVAEVTVPLSTMTLAITLQDISGTGDWRVSDAQPRK
jgi:hypothetical protein